MNEERKGPQGPQKEGNKASSQKKRRFPPKNKDFKKKQVTPEHVALEQLKKVNPGEKKGHFVAWNEIHEKKRKEIQKSVDKKVDGMYTKKSKSPFKRFFGKGKWNPLRVIPIGGLDEVGGNSMIVEYENDLILIDCGVLFADSSLPGVDYVIPDYKYAIANKKRLRAIVITHGHLDHIGALSHVLPKLGYPEVYAPKFAIGLMERSMTEKGIWKQVKHKVHRYKAGDSIKLGKITVEMNKVDHSIPDAFCAYIQTPAAKIVHTGDFRMNMEHYKENAEYIKALRGVGKRGVDLMMADSTNAIVPGHVVPESTVVENMEKVISEAKGRVFIATFSTLTERVQSIIDIAKRTNRKVFLNGRSMLNNTILARDLGYIKYKEGDVKRVTKHINRLKDDQIIVITTGSQGEQYAGLTRIALGSHQHLALKEGDTVIHSARVIGENSANLLNVINNCIRKGAEVLFKFNCPIKLHTSGHAYQEDIRLMMELLSPKHIMPLHGELFMRKEHLKLGQKHGIPPERTHLIENGDALEICKGEVRTIANAVTLDDLVVENGFEGDMSDPVISERHQLKENGVLVVTMKVNKSTRKLVSNPKIISRGFVFKNLAQSWTKELSKEIRKEYEKLLSKVSNQKKQRELVAMFRSALKRYIVTKYEKEPIILPVFIEQ